MRKSLFAIGLLAAIGSVQAQNVLLHVDDAANTYVSEGALVYSGGGVQTRGDGTMDIHGNVMIVGAAGDAFKTITTLGADKTFGGSVMLRLNTPGSYATSTYGQLYIDGISQDNITGIVSKEFRAERHGNSNSYFQQIAMPFSGKVLGSLSAEFGKNFNINRNGEPILKWDNTNAVSNHFTNLATGATSDPTGYYMLKSTNNNLNTATPPVTQPTIAPTLQGTVYTLNGKPYANLTAPVILQNAGNVNFGPGGSNKNAYNESYNTYLDDSWEYTISPWAGTFGKNIYQFGNPFLTNLDLSKIGYVENGGVTDGNNISNIWGVEYNPGTVVTLPNGATYATGNQVQNFGAGGIPVGDIGLLIKPMQSFKIKLRDNTLQTLDFNTLRRFANTTRAAGTDYSVVAAKHTGGSNKGTTNTLKQLGVIALDASGKEIGRSYYVVSPTSTTGHQNTTATTVQARALGGIVLGTFEEAPTGGYDPNYSSVYALYINEANEDNFKGKNIKLVNFNSEVKSYKFEIRENAELINPGVHQLSSGTGFYYKAANGSVQQAKQGETVPVTGSEYDLYYGEPSNLVLAVDTKATAPVRTQVVYNSAIENYIVRFDPNWKKADIEVYDMSGKLVISKKAVDASRDFVIELDGKIKNSYIVKVVSDKGDIVNTKILK
ncbi:T9SS type A sorting domain-containing protein [Chryseobacterium daeguense]|uniref:T9SS type A sorting domain-containing protein n=1 Tax=Chryseobacterium daeguense TaxID=412438 RepID=UPI00041E0DAD|nr:T9SS type A sorting domain-containing protein [Chryseobacterium daeguense]